MKNAYVLCRIQDANNEENPKELCGVFVGPAKSAKEKARKKMSTLLRSEWPPEKDNECSSGGIEIYWSKKDMFLIERVNLYEIQLPVKS